jgi:hypothetical protein
MAASIAAVIQDSTFNRMMETLRGFSSGEMGFRVS